MNAAQPGALVTIPIAVITVVAVVLTVLAILLRPHGHHREDWPPLRVRVLYAAVRHMPRYWQWHPLHRARALIAGVELRLHWWDWGVVQSYWYRQYKRADRKAFAAEVAAIKLRSAAPEGGPAPAPLPGRDASGYPYAPLPADTVTDMPAVPDPPIARSWTPENAWTGAS